MRRTGRLTAVEVDRVNILGEFPHDALEPAEAIFSNIPEPLLPDAAYAVVVAPEADNPCDASLPAEIVADRVLVHGISVPGNETGLITFSQMFK